MSSVQLKISKQLDQRHFGSYGEISDKWSAAFQAFKNNCTNAIHVLKTMTEV